MDPRAFFISLMSGMSVIVLGTAAVSLSWGWLLEILVLFLGSTVTLALMGYAFKPTAELDGGILRLRGVRLKEDLDLKRVVSYRAVEKVRAQFRWKGSNGFRYQSGTFRVDGRDSFLCYDRRIRCAAVLYTADKAYILNRGS